MSIRPVLSKRNVTLFLVQYSQDQNLYASVSVSLKSSARRIVPYCASHWSTRCFGQPRTCLSKAGHCEYKSITTNSLMRFSHVWVTFALSRIAILTVSVARSLAPPSPVSGKGLGGRFFHLLEAERHQRRLKDARVQAGE